MLTKNKELLYAFLVAIFILLVLAAFITVIILLHNRKVNRMGREQEIMKSRFEQALLESRLEVEEQTRKNIAQELHDNVGSLSSLIKINLSLFSIEMNPQKKNDLISECKELIKKLIIELKQLSLSLNTERIGQLGLVEMLKIDVERLKRLNLFDVHLSVHGEESAMVPDSQIIVYRIIQEALHNSLKHANPASITITVRFETKFMLIKIQDDGAGFSESQDNNFSGHSSGLANMRSRAKLLNGTFHLESFPGRGTCCTIEIPANSYGHAN